MNVYYDISEIPSLHYTITTIGTYDGVHWGHQKILQRINTLSRQNPQAESVVITFHPHPRFVLFPEEKNLKILSILPEKIRLLEYFGINHLVVLPFTKALSETSALLFIEEVLVQKLSTKKLVIGYDHRFGKNREGGFDYLKENEERFGFEVEEISRQDIDEIAVSSTKIRNALLSGDLTTANSFLDYEYSLRGIVVHGEKIGRTLGYPTANIEPQDKHKLIPAQGIYAVRVRIKNLLYKGMLSIGVRPTIADALKMSIEVNIFDFDGDIYGEEIEIIFVKYLRKEEKYDSLETLTLQLHQDKEEALAALAIPYQVSHFIF